MALAVGQTCVWYPHAESNQAPQAGIVTEIKQVGVYVMYIFPKGGGTPVQKTNVHRVGAEYLINNPNMRVMYGGWDTVESAEKRRVSEEDSRQKRSAEAAAESERYNRKEQESARVAVLSDRGFPPEEIAKKMGDDWTVEAVEEVIEQHEDAQPA